MRDKLASKSVQIEETISGNSLQKLGQRRYFVRQTMKGRNETWTQKNGDTRRSIQKNVTDDYNEKVTATRASVSSQYSGEL